MRSVLTKAAVALLALFSASVSAQSLVVFAQRGGGVSFEAPRGWQQDPKSDYLSVGSPGGEVALTASAYRKPGQTLREFANHRFSSVQAFNKQVGPEREIRGGVYREYEGVWPGEKDPTYYVVSARQVGGDFVSLTVVTDRSDFEKNRALYVRIMESGRIAP